MRWEDVHRAAVYAEVNSGKHNKKNGRENLAAAGAAAARALATLRPGTTAKQCVDLVTKERAQAQVGILARSTARNYR